MSSALSVLRADFSSNSAFLSAFTCRSSSGAVRKTHKPFRSKGSGLLAMMPFLRSLHIPFWRYAMHPLLRSACWSALLIVLVPDLIPIKDRKLSVGSISSRSVWVIPGTIVQDAMMFFMMGGRLSYLELFSVVDTSEGVDLA